jgi:hypothetical protein
MYAVQNSGLCSKTTSTKSCSCMGDADLACKLPFLQSMLAANQSVMALTTSALQSEKLFFCRCLFGSLGSRPTRGVSDFAAPDFPTVHPKLFTAYGQQKAENVALATDDDSETEVACLRISKPLGEGLPFLPCTPSITDSNNGFEVTWHSHVLQSRRCWKSFLLRPTSCSEYNERGGVLLAQWYQSCMMAFGWVGK